MQIVILEKSKQLVSAHLKSSPLYQAHYYTFILIYLVVWCPSPPCSWIVSVSFRQQQLSYPTKKLTTDLLTPSIICELLVHLWKLSGSSVFTTSSVSSSFTVVTRTSENDPQAGLRSNRASARSTPSISSSSLQIEYGFFSLNTKPPRWSFKLCSSLMPSKSTMSQLDIVRSDLFRKFTPCQNEYRRKMMYRKVVIRLPSTVENLVLPLKFSCIASPKVSTDRNISINFAI